MTTGVSFETLTGHVVDVDWPAVARVAGVTIYGEWESPPSETSPTTARYRVTKITSKYSRMAVVPQTFADFTANFWLQLVVRHFNLKFSHTAGGGKRNVSTSTIMMWVHMRSAVLRLHFLGKSAAGMSVVGHGLTLMSADKLKAWWDLLVVHGLAIFMPTMIPNMLKSACSCMAQARFMLHCPADSALTVVLGADRASLHFREKATFVQPVSPLAADGSCHARALMVPLRDSHPLLEWEGSQAPAKWAAVPMAVWR